MTTGVKSDWANRIQNMNVFGDKMSLFLVIEKIHRLALNMVCQFLKTPLLIQLPPGMFSHGHEPMKTM